MMPSSAMTAWAVPSPHPGVGIAWRDSIMVRRPRDR